MKLEWKDIREHTSSEEEYLDVIGVIHGYSKESRNFFKSKIRLKGFKSALGEQGMIDIMDSGLLGTGYISNPKELKDLSAGKIFKQDIINGINKRRALNTPFTEKMYNPSKAKMVWDRLMLIKRGRVPISLSFDIDKVESPYKEILITVYNKSKK